MNIDITIFEMEIGFETEEMANKHQFQVIYKFMSECNFAPFPLYTPPPTHA